eukprot:GFUD01059971.1.p1 GENE.GFUD01059971.1~~GFUD01059971.1.p1  ORF type:complete len:104 (+),score=34.54 GFUD01059971.1:34-345(+)
MSSDDGHAWKFGLTFICLGLCSVLSMGIYSASHPHKPLTQGQSLCADPPPLDPPGKIDLAGMTAEYACPEDQELAGPAQRICKEDMKWHPGPEEKTTCQQGEF